MIQIKDDIGYSASTKAAYILSFGPGASDGKKFSVPAERSLEAGPYAPWGDDNEKPYRMACDIENCGVLSALDALPRIAAGKGLQPFLLLNVDKEGKEDLEWVSDSEIHDWLELNDDFGYSVDSMFDKFGYGLATTQLLLSRNRKRVNRIKRFDVVDARLEKMDKTGSINNVYLSADWRQYASVDSEFVKTIPLLEEGSEARDLMDREAGWEFAVINRNIRNGRSYYPNPLWYSAKKWVDIAKSIPAMKMAMFRNQMTIKYLVTISSGYWRRIHRQWDTFTSEQRTNLQNDKLKEIDKYLTGVDNQYKSLITSSYIDPGTKQEVSDIKIEVLDDKMADGKFNPDSAAANSEILFAMCVNPALVGAGQPGGAYSNNAGGSNIRESYLTQIMLLERERRQNAKVFNIVKQYNGWAKRLEVERNVFAATPVGNTATLTPVKMKPRLVFRYPSGLLTTLDTGKSTKGEVL